MIILSLKKHIKFLINKSKIIQRIKNIFIVIFPRKYFKGVIFVDKYTIPFLKDNGIKLFIKKTKNNGQIINLVSSGLNSLFSNGYLCINNLIFQDKISYFSKLNGFYFFKNYILKFTTGSDWTYEIIQNRWNKISNVNSVKYYNLPIINLSNNSNFNFYHWLFSPGLINYSEFQRLYSDKINDCFFYVGSSFKNNLPSYMIDSFKLLNIPNDKILYDDCVSELMFSTYLNHSNDYYYHEPHLNFLIDKFKPSKNNFKTKKIFISRRKSKSRRLVNELDFINNSFFSDFLFVVLEDMCLQDQIDLFNSASIIISPHGAGLSNIIFCHSDTLVIELLPFNFHRNHYRDLSKILNLNYLSIVSPNKLNDSDDFYIKPITLIGVLQ